MLIFEEVIGPTTGDAADADPAHRHAVRLTRIRRGHRPAVSGQADLSRSSGRGGRAAVPAVPVGAAAGAGLSADRQHQRRPRQRGPRRSRPRRSREPLGPVGPSAAVGACACEGSVVETTIVPARFTAALQGTPLTFARAAYAPCAFAPRALHCQDPRAGTAAAVATGTRSATARDGRRSHSGRPRYDLLESGPDDRAFVARSTTTASRTCGSATAIWRRSRPRARDSRRPTGSATALPATSARDDPLSGLRDETLSGGVDRAAQPAAGARRHRARADRRGQAAGAPVLPQPPRAGDHRGRLRRVWRSATPASSAPPRAALDRQLVRGARRGRSGAQ